MIDKEQKNCYVALAKWRYQMRFGMSMSYRQVQRQTLTQRLTQSQRLAQKIAQTVITPRAVCPECDKELDIDEIEMGWLNDVFNTTTKCTGCGHRFTALLDTQNKEDGSTASYFYLCKDQLFYRVKEEMKQRANVGEKFLQDRPELLWNWVKHFGNYKVGLKAFKAWRNTLS